MNYGGIRTTLATCVLLVGANLAKADETKPPLPLTATASPAPIKTPSAKNKNKNKPKLVARAPKAKMSVSRNLVELNSAPKAQLLTLPGITDAYADKIIAGRPYVSKSNIVTRHILPDGFYGSLHTLIYVVPPAAKK